MSSSSLNLEEIASILRSARTLSKPIAAPTKTWLGLTADAAFKIQQLNSAHAVEHGDRLVGYKLGNIAKVMQSAFNLDHPDYGVLHSSLFVYEGTSIHQEKFIKPFVELEVGFVLKGPLRGPNVTVADVISAVDYAVPAIEIIDSRVREWAIELPDTLADNGSTGAVILGGAPRRLTDLTLNNMRGVLKFNGQEVMAGNTRNVLGNPIAAVAWLVNRLAEYGIEFLPGQFVLPGSCLEAIPMEEKGVWEGTFEGFGTVEFEVV
ncbi:TodF product hydratase [Aspergillus carlsbadensis]|nr:TodF product hydratase [Aspergillus carlsbadensis]